MRRADAFDHDFVFHAPATRAGFRNDELHVTSWAAAPELLALSYGLAQSVKLHVYEGTIDGLVEATRGLPVELARHGAISLPASAVRRLIGQLLAARYSVSLVSDILDSPEFFWSHPELERLHTEAVAAVELRHRARILDARVQVIRDALEVLNSELAQSSSNRVERAILFLIFVEVLFEVYNQATRHWGEGGRGGRGGGGGGRCGRRRRRRRRRCRRWRRQRGPSSGVAAAAPSRGAAAAGVA
ncbi:hypothetical protein BU14_0332s0028 [Porphyra umbilicalis]|uniref:DUF155 domain-containing protein n=1 Tax=Porphyra umbilicalis TaxID=2786 RepID=A0A1X6NYU9_PORUM|nr:hypothetical protein BU14_0332s0028 [Porphyra umbilicalis]|eukprot:OSX73676.1 hypothetical protein BU14_0332s0028 [Porphyra umbilicalis]